MKKIKKVIVLLLCLTSILTAIPVRAAETNEVAGVLEELEKRITETLQAGEYAVDISGIDMNYNTFVQYYDMCPYFAKGIRAFNIEEGDEINLINPLSAEETEQLLATVNGKIAEIDRLTTEDMTDLEKALTVHDYLVYHSEYDYENYINGTLSYDSNGCGGLMANGRGVCDAYASAFQYFMLREGIECKKVVSTEMNHAWNVVKIDGNYYHVDCTWDDPVPDRMGMVDHTNFLVSDTVMENGNSHYGWNRTGIECADASYDSAWWREVESQIIPIDGCKYYMEDGVLYSRSGENVQKMVKLDHWPYWQDTNKYWMAYYSGLFYKNGYLYYNTAEEIMRISVEAGASLKPEVVYEPDLSDGYIYGLYGYGDEIKYIIKQSYADEGTVYTAPVSTAIPVESIFLDRNAVELTRGDTLQLTAKVQPANTSVPLTWRTSDSNVAEVDENGLVITKAEGTAVITAQSGDISASCTLMVKAPACVLGDVNSDGDINILDLRLVLRAVCRKVELTAKQQLAADVTENSLVNIEDLRMILRYICGKIEEL